MFVLLCLSYFTEHYVLSYYSTEFITVVACVGISFLFRAEQYFIVWMDIFFIHSFGDGHLGSFQLLTIVKSAAVNLGVQIYLQDPTSNSFGYIFYCAILYPFFLTHHSSCSALGRP